MTSLCKAVARSEKTELAVEVSSSMLATLGTLVLMC